MVAPWLSVVMPVHAGEQWLAETLASVAREQAPGIEVILLDSSEDDACERIAGHFAETLDLHYERRTDIKPWPAKTNLAVERARAPHVCVLHQDDLWLGGRVAAVRKAIAAAPDVALLLFASHIIDPSSDRLGTWRCPLRAGRSLPAESVAERLLVQNFVALPAPVMRRDYWLAAGGMDETLWYTADWDIYLKLARLGAVRYEPIATTAFRIHANSLTVSGSRDRADFVDQMTQVIDRHMDMVRPGERRRVRRYAATSVRVNDALAAAARGERGAFADAIRAMLRLGPIHLGPFLRDTRLRERVWPRIRAKLAGSF